MALTTQAFMRTNIDASMDIGVLLLAKFDLIGNRRIPARQWT